MIQTQANPGLPRRVVVALGGNAILKPGQEGRAEDQLDNVRATCQ